LGFAALAAGAAAACSTPDGRPTLTLRDNQPLARIDFESGYRLKNLPAQTASRDLLVVLAFSGGGKRSAAFSYGVLEALRRMKLPGNKGMLLDHVALISAVSGGSFTAAYYGLHRDRIFTEYREKFLYRDIEAYIWGAHLLPWHWSVSGNHGTNDRMAEVYDQLLFGGATYKHLKDKGRPLIAINATDVVFGSVFQFTQEYFDHICSDLLPFPVARAVAASNGFPVVLSPITLINHWDSRCVPRMPRDPVVRPIRHVRTPREFQREETQHNYHDRQKYPYVHLLDGGIADNLAIRPLIDTIARGEERADLIESLRNVRRILVLVADGQSQRDLGRSQQRRLSGLKTVFDAVTGTQIDAYNFETRVLAFRTLIDFRDELRCARCRRGKHIDGHPCDDVWTYMRYLPLGGPGAEELAAIPTGLTISREQVDAIIKMAHRRVDEDTQIKFFVEDLLDEKKSFPRPPLDCRAPRRGLPG
jgi:NTE family protein